MLTDQDIKWCCEIAKTISGFIPVAGLVFCAHVDLLVWSQVNLDSAKPVRSPFREILGNLLAFPLFYCPGLYAWFCKWLGKNGVFVAMAANALFWELFFPALVGRYLPDTIFKVNALSEVLLNDRTLLDLLLIGR